MYAFIVYLKKIVQTERNNARFYCRGTAYFMQK